MWRFFRNDKTARVLNGRKVANKIERNIKAQGGNIKPGLAIVQVGNNAASTMYTSMKARACDRVGFYSENHRLDAGDSQEKVIEKITELVQDPKIHGILVQLPLPKHLDEERVLEAVAPEKDVDGFNSLNTNRLMSRNRPPPRFVPCTPLGIMQLLHEYRVPIAGKHAVVVGNSNIVGMPIAHCLLQEQATVTVCHKHTTNLIQHCRQADILVTATGIPRLITADYIKMGACVIDVGIAKEKYTDPEGRERTRTVGDVDYPSVCKVAGSITPVPGGVGPMTIAMLLANTFKAAHGIQVLECNLESNEIDEFQEPTNP